MKKKIKAVRILFATSFVMLCAILSLILIKPDTEKAPVETKEYIITDISVADIGALAITNDSGTFGLMCYGVDVEMVDTSGNSDIKTVYNQSEMRSLVYAASHVKAVKQLSEGADPADYGMNMPAATVVLLGNDGSSIKFTILSKNDIDGSYYLYSEIDGRLYVISEKEAALFLRSSMDFAAHEVFPVVSASDIQSVSKVELIHADGSGYTIENISGVFYITEPIYQRLRSSVVYSDLIVALSSLYSDSCLTLDGGLEKFRAEPYMTISMNADSVDYTASFAEKDGKHLMENSDTGAVYEISGDLISGIPYEEADLLHGSPYCYSLGDCKSLTIKTPNAELFFEISGSGESISAVCDGMTLDAQSVSALSKAVNGVEISQSAEITDGIGTLTLVFTLANGSNEIVEFIPKKSGEYAVRVNGVTNFTTSAYSVSNIFSIVDQYV